MHNHVRVVTIAVLVLFALSFSVAAQCTVVPNTGCPGATAPNCAGSAQVGQTFTVGCVTSGRATGQFIAIGGCPQAPFPFPAGCVAGCTLGFDPLQPAAIVNTGFAALPVAVPNDPTLVGATFCFQCIELVMTCLAFAPAVQVTIS